MSPNTLADRRIGSDRRKRRFRAFLYQFTHQRRRSDRRRVAAPSYVDIHEPLLLLVILTALLLCIIDSYNTLLLLDLGGVEINPLMRELIDRNATLFFSVKYVLTAFCLIILLVHKRFVLMKIVSGYHVIIAVICGYMILIGYQYRLLALI
jgi:hypothetical protein